MTEKTDEWKVPAYIAEGLKWLENELVPNTEGSTVNAPGQQVEEAL